MSLKFSYDIKMMNLIVKDKYSIVNNYINSVKKKQCINKETNIRRSQFSYTIRFI